MKFRSKRLKKGIVGILAVLLLVSMFAEESRTGNITTITSSKGYSESAYNVGVGKFTVSGIDGVSHFAFCACHELKLPGTGMKMNTVVSNNTNLRKVLFYGYGGPADKGYSYTQTSIAVSVANGHFDTDWTGETENPLGAPMVQAVSKLADPGSTFTVYYAYSTDSSAQDLVYWTYNPEGKLTLTKASANPSLTDNNSCYSLEGAEYGVYSNSACTTKVGTLITKADGTTL